MIPYPTDDDAAARDFIGRHVNTPHPALWAELCAPDRVDQTVRALQTLMLDTQAQHAARNAEFELVKKAWRDGSLAPKDYEELARERQQWRARVARWTQACQKHLAEAKRARRDVNRAESAVANEDQELEMRRLLAAVIEAIARHQLAVEEDGYEATPADTALWAHLDILRFSTGHPLRDMVKRRLREVAS